MKIKVLREDLNNKEDYLSKEQLRSYNMMMLDRGEPNRYDYVGYNKFHYKHMLVYSKLNRELKNEEALHIARTLKKYVRTQLQEIRGIINNTVEYYYACTVPKLRNDNKIQIAGFTKDRIAILWQFGNDINNQLKERKLNNKFHLKWQNTEGAWILRIDWKYIQEITDIFEEIGLDCSNIISAGEFLSKKIKKTKKKN